MKTAMTAAIAATFATMPAAAASEYDFYLLIDQSGSMSYDSNQPGLSRWKQIEEVAAGLANYLSTGNNGQPIDTDGFTLITFNDTALDRGNFNSVAAIGNLFAKEGPGGGTNLAAAITLLQQKMKSSNGKKAMAFCYTDGAPQDQQAAINAICSIVKTMKTDGDFAISFVQVGNDAGATQFLEMLDDGLQTKYNLPFDAVDCNHIEEIGLLTPGQLMQKALDD